MDLQTSKRPWYREPWPWILMAPPAAAVLAGAVTLWLAIANADEPVARAAPAAPASAPAAREAGREAR